MFGRKKKKPDLDWQPGVDPEIPDADVASSSVEQKNRQESRRKSQQKGPSNARYAECL